jgi:signal transduction histidine kinase
MARRKPLRRELLLLALAGMLPLAALAVIGLAFDFEEQTAQAHRRALETTRALATAVDAEMERSFAALRVIASSEAFDRGDIPALEGVARRAARSQEGWRFVSMADRDGRHLINTFFKPGEPLPDKQREADSFQRALETAQPVVGALVQGRMGWSFPLRLPVMREGRVAYVLTAVVNPAAVQEILARQRIADDWVASVFDAAGTRVARSRAHEKMIGTRGHASLVKVLSQGRNEGVGVSQTLEGEDVFTAYTRIPGSGWTVVMGLPISAVQAPAWTGLAITSSVVVLSLLLGLGAAALVARRINMPMARLRAAAAALGRGEAVELPSAPVSEIDEVGSALVTASAQLKAVEAERVELLRRERLAREQAEAASRAKDQFLAMLGHELRNPLAGLSSASSLLRMSDDPQMRARAQDVIARQVGNLTRLTDDILDTARVVLGKVELRSAPVDLARVAANALLSVAPTAQQHGHSIEQELEEAWVMGDETRLEQVVCNLLVNATKYTPPGKRIRVTTRRSGDEALVVVQDEGQGMTPELVERAFDPFTQGERNPERAQGGLGIGLTLVRSLVRMHGGEVTVKSEGEDRGTEFTVAIPATTRPADVPRRAETQAL